MGIKLSIRALLGILLGTLLGLYLPDRAGDTGALFGELSDLVISIGRFFLFPLVFFSAITAVDELREESKLLSTLLWTLALVLVTTLGSVVIALAMILIFAPERIPPILQEGEPLITGTLGEILSTVFPRNLFSLFAADGDALLPVLVLAFLLGAVLRHDRHVTDPVAAVVDSASRIFYRLSGVVTEFIGIGLIAIAAHFILTLRRTSELVIYRQLILVVGVAVLLIAVIFYPLALYLLQKRRSPAGWLASMVAPALQAAVSGDLYFAYPTLVRAVSRQRNVGRRRGATVLPVATIFGRAGSAAVTAATFVVVIRSYTALEIGVAQILWILLFAVLFSLMLSRFPAAGVPVLLGTMAARYGQGMEEAYLIVLPVIPVLLRLGAFLDTLTAGFIVEILGASEQKKQSKRR
ncbi:MAG: dicarboxylate/amino acid:cation symporter [Spirochaetaceae bacterium]